MGFNATTIQSNYQELVGFRQTSNPDITPIPATSFLLTSDSGINVTDVEGIDYALLQAIKNDDFAYYYDQLEYTYNQAVINTLTKFWNNKKGIYKTKDLLENRVLNQSAECYDDKKTFDGFARGFKIKPFKSNNIKLEATKFSILLDTSGTFNIYVYSTKQKTPLTVKAITAVADTATSVDLTGAIVYAQSNGIALSELLILVYGYNTADPKASIQLPANAYGYSQPHERDCKYVSVECVEFNANDWNWNATTGKYDLPDLSQMAYTCETFGLNVRFKVECDFTQLMIDNRLLFAPIIQKAVAISLLWQGVTTTNSNAITESRRETWRNLALKYEAELYGYTDENKAQVQGYFEKVDFDLSNLDTICLPSQNYAPRTVSMPYGV
jgi:hypothetical protein